MIDHKCENCGCTHKVRKSDLKRGWGKTCSKSCAASIKAKKPNSNYKKFMNRQKEREKYGSFVMDFSEGWDGHKR